MSERHPADHYAEAARRVIELLDANIEHHQTEVSACPGWTVLDVARHVVGLAADVVDGQVDGYAGATWTQRQVDARKHRSWPELREEWTTVIPDLVAINLDLEGSSLPATIRHVLGPVPKMMFLQAFTVDLVQHEFDIRHSIGMASPQLQETIRLVVGALVANLRAVFAVRGFPTIQVIATDTDDFWLIGRGVPEVSVAGSLVDLMRALGGRRTVQQIRDMQWQGTPGDDLVTSMIVPFFAAPDVAVEAVAG